MPMPAPRLLVPLALALALAGPLAAQDARRVAPVRTGFDPRLDGMPFENLGDYASPEGNCFGMSLLAVDNYLRRMKARAEGRPDPQPLPITRRAQDGHAEAQILASLAQAMAGAQDDEENSPVQPVGVRDQRLMREALERMRQTGVPELVGLYSEDSGHEVVVFGYEDGKLLVYDPNYPGETLRWPWDPVRGFGPHPMRRDDPEMYAALVEYDVAPFSAFRTARELGAIRDACAQGLDRCVARFPQLEAGLEGREVRGKVGPGLARGEDGIRPHRPYRVWLVVNGKPVASGRVQRDGSFRIRIPAGTRTEGARLQLIAVTEEGALAGANDMPNGAPASPGFTSALGGM